MTALLALTRREAFEIRRDASEPLSNGRVRYEALFSRWGMQQYPNGVEFRPFDEVFSPTSLASGANNPGVLLHPAANFKTDFGAGAHPIRGTTGDRIIQHADRIHTYGHLIVWDQEWNDQIMSGETAELSVGFSIPPNGEHGEAPEDAPGVPELGRDYVSVHRDIVWDHVAGVPEGNAGTARVMLDAATVSKIHPVTRAAMAKIAAARADARAYYFDMAQWSSRRAATTEKPMNDELKKKLAAAKTPAEIREVLDAEVKISGDQTDPTIMAILEALRGAEAAPVEPPVEPAMGEPAAAPAEQQAADEDVDPESKMDAAQRRLVHDAAVRRADVLISAIEAIGIEYRDAAAGKTIAEIQRDTIAKVEPERLAKIDKHDGAHKAVALMLHFDEVREILDRRRDWGPRILAAIAKTHAEVHDDAEEIDGPIARQRKAEQARKNASAPRRAS